MCKLNLKNIFTHIFIPTKKLKSSKWLILLKPKNLNRKVPTNYELTEVNCKRKGHGQLD